MLNIKESFWDRFGQSFSLFINNFIWLFLPFFLYNFISVVIIWTISKYYMMKNLSWMNISDSMDFFSFLNSPTVVILIVISMILYIVYLSFYIVVFLWFLKSVKQAINNENITIIDNIKYWTDRFLASMKTYWYIFSYIALIPISLFILWWFFLNLWFYFWNIGLLKSIWTYIMWFSLFLTIIFVLYRWVKASFALYNAVDKDSFEKNNFNKSLKITTNNWYRIAFNIFFVGLLLSLLSFIVSAIVSIFSFVWWENQILDSLLNMWLLSWDFKFDPSVIKNILESFTIDFSITKEIIWNIVDNIIWTTLTIIKFIFIYLLFKRLELEFNNTTTKKEVIL